MKNLEKKNLAFTLAEVLITLGIIGIVAALTIPTLIANVKAAQYRTAFKKELSALNQAVKMNKAKYDWDFSSIETYTNTKCTPKDDPSACKNIVSLMKGNMKILGNANDRITGHYHDDIDDYDMQYDEMVKLIALNWYTQNDGYAFELPDGAIILLDDNTVRHPTKKIGQTSYHAFSNPDYDNDSTFGYGWIDVNGASLPNREVQCKEGNTGFIGSPKAGTHCTVDNKTMGDIFPIFFYDSTVEPATNAAKYVLDTTK